MRFSRLTALTPLCFLAAAAMLVPVTGCGGSSSPVINEFPVPAPEATITRETENDFSVDAKILAFRQASGTRLSAEAAAKFDADLAKIRAQYPQVADIHARLDFALTDVLVEVKKDAFRDTWEAGTLTTGEINLDQLLIAFAAVSVSKLSDSGDTRFFLVKLGQSVNVPELAPYLKAASASVVSADANRIIGDGNQISYKLGLDGTKTYTFSVGSGDCASGCINRHFYKITLAPTGELALTESDK